MALTSCATKYIVPTNRFVTPESLGGTFQGQFELGQTNSNQLVVDTSNGDVDHGVTNGETSRTAFNFGTSFAEKFDFLWLHTSGGNSLLGGKFQILGSSKNSYSDGHKFALAAVIGGNDYETDDKSVDFTLNGREFMVLYGYRMADWFLAYSNFSYATYEFEGEISSNDPALNGLKPSFITNARSVSGGFEFTLSFLVSKVECTYQQLETTDTKDKTRMVIGYSIGANW